MDLELKLDIRRQAARAFIASKDRRLPTTLNELAEWLLEFDEYAFQIAENSQRAFMDHMNICTAGGCMAWRSK